LRSSSAWFLHLTEERGIETPSRFNSAAVTARSTADFEGSTLLIAVAPWTSIDEVDGSELFGLEVPWTIPKTFPLNRGRPSPSAFLAKNGDTKYSVLLSSQEEPVTYGGPALYAEYIDPVLFKEYSPNSMGKLAEPRLEYLEVYAIRVHF
jgi:hypothetical protein